MEKLQLMSMIMHTIIQAETRLNTIHVIAGAVLCIAAAVATSLGISAVAQQYCKAVARQPEIKEYLSVRVIIFSGLIDAFSAVALGIAAVLIFSSPLKLDIQKLEADVIRIVNNIETRMEDKNLKK